MRLDGVLAGLRVVSLAVNVPGPVAAARLREMGAGVTKVEPPAGDPLADYAASWYTELVADQRVRRLDLKTAHGRAELEPLLAEADLLLLSMRPAALARLELDEAGLRTRFPTLLVVEAVGYGAPHQERAGHDLTYQAAEGLVAPPTLPRTLVADLAAAERIVSAALALLLDRERRGRCGRARVALSEAAAAFASPLRHGLTGPGSLLGGALPGYEIYPARSGWVAVAALEPHFADRLVAALEIPVLSRESLLAAFSSRDAAEWERWAEARDLPLVAVPSADLPPADP